MDSIRENHVERYFKDVQFLATGSSALEISDAVFEPLTGRYFLFHLYSFSFAELYTGMLPFEMESEVDYVERRGNKLSAVEIKWNRYKKFRVARLLPIFIPRWKQPLLFLKISRILSFNENSNHVAGKLFLSEKNKKN